MADHQPSPPRPSWNPKSDPQRLTEEQLRTLMPVGELAQLLAVPAEVITNALSRGTDAIPPPMREVNGAPVWLRAAVVLDKEWTPRKADVRATLMRLGLPGCGVSITRDMHLDQIAQEARERRNPKLKRRVVPGPPGAGPLHHRYELLTAYAAPEAPEVRREWSMLAHTGKVFARWWGNCALDLDGAHFRQKVPLLKDHNATQPLGYSTKIWRSDRGIEARGRMLTCELADQVIKHSREGFPWQASLLAVPLSVETWDSSDDRAIVNGREVNGPLTIFRQWELHELTIVVLGADNDTAAEAFGAVGSFSVEVAAKRRARDRLGEPLVSQAPRIWEVADG